MKDGVLTKEEFKQVREFLGMTQEEFAIKLGYKTAVGIAYKESGDRSVSKSDSIILMPDYNRMIKSRRAIA